MQKYAVIGLGSYGMHMAKSLKDYGSEVTGIDLSQERLMKARDYIHHSIQGNAADKSFLQSLTLKDMAGVLVAVSGDSSVNILITLALKDMGLKRIIVCANSENHCRILEWLGITEIIYPQRDIAIRIGKTLAMKNVLDYIPLAGEYVVMNIHSPKSFIGMNIRDLQIGARFQCQILGIKYLPGNDYCNPAAPEWENMKIAPSASDIIPEHSMLMFLGKKSDLLRIQQIE